MAHRQYKDIPCGLKVGWWNYQHVEQEVWKGGPAHYAVSEYTQHIIFFFNLFF